MHHTVIPETKQMHHTVIPETKQMHHTVIPETRQMHHTVIPEGGYRESNLPFKKKLLAVPLQVSEQQ